MSFLFIESPFRNYGSHSKTTTLKLRLVLFPDASIAVHVTTVVPGRKTVPEGGVLVTLGVPQVSVATGEKKTGKPLVTQENALPKMSTAALPSKKKATADEMVAWFRSEHGSAIETSPYDSQEGGYLYPTEDDINGVLQDQFPKASQAAIDEATLELDGEGPWLTREFTNALDQDLLRDHD